MVTYTPNKGYGYPAHGAEVNNWDAFLNAIFTNVDLNVAGQNTVTVSTGVATYTLAQGDSGTAQYLQQKVTGTLGSNSQLVFPSTDAGGAFLGIWSISNEATGSFTLTAITTSSTNGGISIAAGGRTLVVSDGTNIWKADNNTVAKVYTYFGSPSGNVAATVATANGAVTDMIWDGTNRVMYMPTATAVSTSSLYTALAPLPAPQGYLTPVSGTPVTTSDQTVSMIYYTPFVGGWTTLPSSGGTSYFPYNFSQQSISISALGANNIYDIYMAYLSSVGVFCGAGPSWTVGGGSITAGSGARGTGAGSAAISRAITGMYVNTNAMSLVNGGTTYSVSAGAAQFLGSVYTASAGAVTLTRSGGQNRVWGISNAYNRQPITLTGYDATASWTLASQTTFRVSNNSTANNVVVFGCLPEEEFNISFIQNGSLSNSSAKVAIGINSTTTQSGYGFIFSNGIAGAQMFPYSASYTIAPAIGINVAYSLEESNTGNFLTMYGGANNMQLAARWRA